MVHKFFNLAVALTTYLFLWLFKLFRVFVLLVVLGLLVLYIYQRRFIYIPENSALEGRQINFNEKLFQKPELWGFSQYEDIYLKSFDGALLHCWHMKFVRRTLF
ncbi:hypothetical protein MHBO_003192 [Bonamia ostreae]|uniref:Uncharacterized protein n=1 Tax=Bonamia ostreae TaxID=126728 RepID=A0ABV2APS3_9EUKA